MSNDEATSRDRPDHRKSIRFAILALLLVGTVMFLLGFHVVLDVPLIVPKDSLSFHDTFVLLDDYVRRWNEASLPERLKLSETNLYGVLRRKHLISAFPANEKGHPSSDVGGSEADSGELTPPSYAPVVSAREICSAFRENEIAAGARFTGSWLIVHGRVDRVAWSFENLPEVYIQPGVRCACMLDDVSAAASLQSGQYVGILALCVGKELDVEFVGGRIEPNVPLRHRLRVTSHTRIWDSQGFHVKAELRNEWYRPLHEIFARVRLYDKEKQIVGNTLFPLAPASLNPGETGTIDFVVRPDLQSRVADYEVVAGRAVQRK